MEGQQGDGAAEQAQQVQQGQAVDQEQAERRPGYVPVLPKLVAREPDKPASATGARKASADYSPVRKGRKRARSPWYYNVSESDSE